MRVFAGPNGSGKTTIFKGLLKGKNVSMGIFVNADEIEKDLKLKKILDFNQFHINVNQDELIQFFQYSKFAPTKRNEKNLFEKLEVRNNFLNVNTSIDSYLAADLAEFIRQKLIHARKSFTYETVMSHPSKIDFMKFAMEQGFKVYLYFIATEDPQINVSRVKLRVAQNGHNVDSEIIKKRYYNSLNNLKTAVINSNRAFIFDNSQKQANFICEIIEGSKGKLNKPDEVPYWVATYLLKNIE